MEFLSFAQAKAVKAVKTDAELEALALQAAENYKAKQAAAQEAAAKHVRGECNVSRAGFLENTAPLALLRSDFVARDPVTSEHTRSEADSVIRLRGLG